jgi:hypothetical protein
MAMKVSRGKYSDMRMLCLFSKFSVITTVIVCSGEFSRGMPPLGPLKFSTIYKPVATMNSTGF